MEETVEFGRLSLQAYYDEDDKCFAVTPVPEVILVAKEYILPEYDCMGGLEYLKQLVIEVREDVIDFTFDNGRWVYEIVRWNERGEAVCELRYEELY